MSFSNPVPVAVSLVPCQHGLIAIRRSIPPQVGQLALPGGYINSGESFQDALSRELLEETGIAVPANLWKVFHVGDAIAANRILLFGICPEIGDYDPSFRSAETSEMTIISPDTNLAFPLHEEARDLFFRQR